MLFLKKPSLLLGTLLILTAMSCATPAATTTNVSVTLNISAAATQMALAKVKLIAIGDPKSVPAGSYAQQAFTELGILAAIQPKFVLGANVTQVLQYVDSGNVDAGVVYTTDALPDSNVTVVATGPANVNASIVYPVAVIKASKNASAAQDYIKFLGMAQAKTVFEKYGFTMAVR